MILFKIIQIIIIISNPILFKAIFKLNTSQYKTNAVRKNKLDIKQLKQQHNLNHAVVENKQGL